MLVPTLGLHSALHSHYLRLVEKLHAEQILHEDLFAGATGLRYLVSSCIVVHRIALPRRLLLPVDHSLFALVDALEGKLLSLLGVGFVVILEAGRKEFDPHQLILALSNFHNLAAVILEGVVADVGLADGLVVLADELLPDRKRHVAVFAFGARAGARPAMKFYVHCAYFCLLLPQLVLFLLDEDPQYLYLVLNLPDVSRVLSLFLRKLVHQVSSFHLQVVHHHLFLVPHI